MSAICYPSIGSTSVASAFGPRGSFTKHYEYLPFAVEKQPPAKSSVAYLGRCPSMLAPVNEIDIKIATTKPLSRQQQFGLFQLALRPREYILFPIQDDIIRREQRNEEGVSLIYSLGIEHALKGTSSGTNRRTKSACSRRGATDSSDSPMAMITSPDTFHGRDS